VRQGGGAGGGQGEGGRGRLCNQNYRGFWGLLFARADDKELRGTDGGDFAIVVLLLLDWNGY
jgi:hypothetical protein